MTQKFTMLHDLYKTFVSKCRFLYAIHCIHYHSRASVKPSLGVDRSFADVYCRLFISCSAVHTTHYYRR